MSILQALDGYYDRMAARNEVEPPGYSREKISFAIVISAQGEPVAVRDLRQQNCKKLLPRQISVPAAVKRTVGIMPNLFWDKSAYILGRTLGTGKRTADEHAAFKKMHFGLLADANDPGLVALRRFLEQWKPDRFDTPPFVTDMLDANLVFRLDGDEGLLHERDAAHALVAAAAETEGETAFCLVTGRRAPIRRLHPSIKNVDGAQSSGAALVSFNLDAFTSYGKEQGDNAPTGEAAAFRYGEALNRLLDRSSRNRIKIGDATVVFWAETSETVKEKQAAAAEDFMASFFVMASRESNDEDEQEAAKLNDALQSLRKGRPVEALGPNLKSGTRFHILGLSPNAARLSVRFWLTDDFSAFARRLADHAADLELQPKPFGWGAKPPSIQRLLVKTTALMEKFENIPPLLAGEVTRAVLTGARYPQSFFAASVMRLRAGDDASNGWHAAVIKAVLARDLRSKFAKEEIPVSLDRDNPNQAYQLGRLFAAVETAQRAALGKVNATIRDRYFGAASATPAAVFPILIRGVQNHLGKLRKSGKGIWLEREIEEITSQLAPQFPRALKLEEQGRFALGYYHQRRGQFTTKEAEAEIESLENQGNQDV